MTDIDDRNSFGIDGVSPAPDLMAPVHGFRDWRITDAGLCSPRTDMVWESTTVRAHCRPQNADDFVRGAHDAPGRDCNCGIHVQYAFSPEFSKVDYQGVSGVVTVWGHVEAHEHGMRAEFARLQVLGLYARWTRRQKDAVRDLAERLDVDLVDLYELPDAAHAYATPMPTALIPGHGAWTPRRRPLAPIERRERLVIVGH